MSVAVLNVMADGFDSTDSEEGRGCTCTAKRNPCASVTTTKNIGCDGNTYLQCIGTVCSNQTCPAQQLFNRTLGACSSCPSDQHVAANNQECACNVGNTFNYTARACVKCPSGSTENPDYCFCPNTTALDVASNACKDCPANSVISFGRCKCTSPMIWSSSAWSCISCPTELNPDRDGDSCVCPGHAQMFDMTSATCVCIPGWQINTTTNTCQRASTSG